jgi:flagellin
MALSVLTNVASLNAQRNLAATQSSLAQSIGRLSSGMRINTAADDAAGLGISENLKADLRSMAQAQRNANDGVSMTQVAEGAMGEIAGIVTRMRELAVQSANQTLGGTERGYIQTEFTQLRQKLIDGSASAGLSFQIGKENTTNDRLSMSITKVTASTLGSTSLHLASATLSTVTGARNALGAFDKAIEQLSTARSKVGAVQNRMVITISNLSTAQENLAAANSRIRDVDVASESSVLTKNQILSQAGMAVLSQANQLPQSALSLLR